MEGSTMKRIVYAIVGSAALAFAPLAMVTVATAPVSSAEPMNCAQGEYWDPTGNVCRPLGVGPQPLDCAAGEYWEPVDNVCKPLGQP
jgi:hypothetical protein